MLDVLSFDGSLLVRHCSAVQDDDDRGDGGDVPDGCGDGLRRAWVILGLG